MAMGKDLGDLLVERGILTPDQLTEARQAMQSAKGTDIGRIVVDLGYTNERKVAETRAGLLGLDYVDLSGGRKPQPDAIKAIPEALARRHTILPLAKSPTGIMVAVADPNDIQAIDDLRMHTRGMMIKMVLSASGDIEDAIDKAYSNGIGPTPVSAPLDGAAGAPATTDMGTEGTASKDLMGLIGSELEGYKSREAQMETTSDADELVNEAPIVRVANTIIQQAILQGSSDIHVEAERKGVRVRYRIDGVLQEVMNLPRYLQPPLISRYKIMSDMNIAERRIPQDGRIAISFQNKDYDLRVSCLPTMFGEKIVMRILDKSSVLIGLNKLGFYADNQATLEELIVQPNGMILSTGPTGSGKTTTQYSVLNKINSVEKNIITIEDPVEYQLPGINQVQVHRKAGLTFASALRSFLRQDPDIIMVGEIRDLETAEIAIEASLTGHLVLSTLHTNDAASAVTRLVDMGVEPYLVSATLIGVLAQRLARRICTKCRTGYEVEAHELRRFGYRPENENDKVTLYRGEGCEACSGRGFKGRMGIYEMMVINDEIADLMVRRAPLSEIREAARANGMSLLREDGLRKVLEGLTTPDEVMRVVFTAGH
ncbi:MAG TPA: ATPase, T2SS/T4P/T4SS family [Armatimonadota bacterium]|jgi:type IV pilus assembly protein PilB|nr:ATPase, T2SS/T4P/T4SS family [Armatimonadota bacterium]